MKCLVTALQEKQADERNSENKMANFPEVLKFIKSPAARNAIRATPPTANIEVTSCHGIELSVRHRKMAACQGRFHASRKSCLKSQHRGDVKAKWLSPSSPFCGQAFITDF